MNDTADPLALIRNALSAQFDQNAIVVLTGPATNLAGLLALPGTPPLIAKKVRTLVMAADASHAERRCPPPSVCSPSGPPRSWWPAANWATPSLFRRPASRRISPGRRHIPWWPPIAPTARCRTMRPAVAMAAALYAVRPQENYFKVSDPGTVQCRRRWTPPSRSHDRRQASYADRRRQRRKSGSSRFTPKRRAPSRWAARNAFGRRKRSNSVRLEDN